MELLSSVLTWLMSVQAPYPDALFVSGAVFVWTLCVWGAASDDDNPLAGLAVLGGILGIFSILGALADGHWRHVISGVTGLGVLPGILGIIAGVRKSVWGIKRGWKALQALVAEQRRLAEEGEKRAREALAAHQAAMARDPKNVLKRCEAVVAQVRKALPLDLEAPEEWRQAQTKLDAMKQLFVLLDHLNELVPDTVSLEAKITAADALYSETSLEDEVGPFIAMLRDSRATVEQRRNAIRAAIEALALSITTLPERVAARLAKDPPVDYQMAAADLATEHGMPVLPEIASAPDSRSLPNPKKQLA